MILSTLISPAIPANILLSALPLTTAWARNWRAFEARVALEELFANPPYDVDRGRIERVSSLLLRGIKHMPMRFGD